MPNARGHFIVLDGPEGAGKSTQVRLLTERLAQRGLAVETVRDPGGTPVSERVRQVLLDPAVGHLEAATEMFLYMASRTELVARVIRPALAAGRTVLCDRFVSSTVVYQGYAGGLDPAEILRVGRLACGDAWPDLTVLLDVPADEGFGRIRREHDRMELKGLEFHRRVAEGFRQLARSDPQQYVLIDARGSVEEVSARIWKAVERVLR
jgi:dTMP kinase